MRDYGPRTLISTSSLSAQGPHSGVRIVIKRDQRGSTTLVNVLIPSRSPPTVTRPSIPHSSLQDMFVRLPPCSPPRSRLQSGSRTPTNKIQDGAGPRYPYADEHRRDAMLNTLHLAPSGSHTGPCSGPIHDVQLKYLRLGASTTFTASPLMCSLKLDFTAATTATCQHQGRHTKSCTNEEVHRRVCRLRWVMASTSKGPQYE